MDRNSSPTFVMDCNKKTSDYPARDLFYEDAVSLHSFNSFESLYDEILSATADMSDSEMDEILLDMSESENLDMSDSENN